MYLSFVDPSFLSFQIHCKKYQKDGGHISLQCRQFIHTMTD